jgi:nicotinamide-nucleotide amidase
LMKANQLTISVAESCTGGMLSSTFTKHPGCSAVFLGGGIVYSNDLKMKLLDVKENTLTQHGAVSEQTVFEMANGAIKNFNSDYSVAISGIAGPDGGSEEKPVGTIWIAVSNKNETICKQFNFGNKRALNIERAVMTSLTMLFKLLKNNVAIKN